MNEITLSDILDVFPREELRKIAASVEIKKGRDKKDTIKNLVDNWGKVSVSFKFKFS